MRIGPCLRRRDLPCYNLADTIPIVVTASAVYLVLKTLHLDVANLGLEILQLLLDLCVLLGHLLVLALPLVPLGLESLDFSLEVAGLDVGLSEPRREEENDVSFRLYTEWRVFRWGVRKLGGKDGREVFEKHKETGQCGKHLQVI